MAQILCDFDGTITNQDSIIFLTEQFGAGPEFRHGIRQAIKEGRLSVYEAVRQELATINISWKEAVEALKLSIFVDPTFPGFVKWCQDNEHPLAVVSAGMEPVVDLFIGYLELPVYAQALEVTPRGWDYRKKKSNDKEKIISGTKRVGTLVYIGDGTSDVVAIPYADLLLAKVGSYLMDYCESHHVSYIPFENFDDVREAIIEWKVDS